MPDFAFDNSYGRLPDRFFARVAPAPAPAPSLIALNGPLAEVLGLDAAALARGDAAALFSGAKVPDGADPLAMAYAGHQFGHFVPQLGDGRAVLLGEVIDRAGVRRDIQLKGGGQTPFSRRGDGRAGLGPVIREYIVSEAMHALGIPTTRSLAAALTGEMIYREDILPGAVLTRVAASHVRVGTFQYFAARRDEEGLRILADYVIARHDPDAAQADNPYLALIEGAVKRQAALIARWMQVGFIHGVMNTDNMTLSGETIDYGPCAFMDEYSAEKVFSSIDQMGRYAYRNQPGIAQWNLARLAETLLPLIDGDEDKAVERASATIVGFKDHYERAWGSGFAAKLGSAEASQEITVLANRLLEIMAAASADFTNTFRMLSGLLRNEAPAKEALASVFGAKAKDFETWIQDWRGALAARGRDPLITAAAMDRVNPAYIPRNHRVEQAIKAATADGDFKPFETLNAVLAKPFEDQPDREAYKAPPAADERVHVTFCGT